MAESLLQERAGEGLTLAALIASASRPGLRERAQRYRAAEADDRIAAGS